MSRPIPRTTRCRVRSNFSTVRRRSGVKPQGSVVARPPEGAVEDQRVEMNVQVERPAKSLDESDRSAVSGSASECGWSTPGSQRGEDRPHKHAQDRCRQFSIVGQAVAQAEGQRKHPLAYRDAGQYAVHEVRCRVGHVAPSARGAEASPLAGEGNHAIQPAAVAMQPQKTVRRDSAIEELAEFAFDEARHCPFPGTRLR